MTYEIDRIFYEDHENQVLFSVSLIVIELLADSETERELFVEYLIFFSLIIAISISILVLTNDCYSLETGVFQ
jgi:hypothetical protein